jgi:hypothetical protein
MNAQRSTPSLQAGLSFQASGVSTDVAQSFAAVDGARDSVVLSRGLTAAQDSAEVLPTPVKPDVVPPVVTYRDGQLTIDAENVTLASVLELIAEKTGVVIHVPPGSGLERIVEHARPGQVKDVLMRLLQGSHFNFTITRSAQEPYEVRQVLLYPREEMDTPSSASAAPKATDASPRAANSAAVQSPDVNTGLMSPRRRPMSPEALAEMMKQRAQWIRNRDEQQLETQQPVQPEQQQPLEPQQP